MLITQEAFNNFQTYKDRLLGPYFSSTKSHLQLEWILRTGVALTLPLNPSYLPKRQLGGMVELRQHAGLLLIIGLYNHKKILLAIEPQENLARYTFLIDFKGKPLLVSKGVLEEFVQRVKKWGKKGWITSLKSHMDQVTRLTRDLPVGLAIPNTNQQSFVDYWASPRGRWIFQIEQQTDFAMLVGVTHSPALLESKPFALEFHQRPLIVTTHAIRRFNRRWLQGKKKGNNAVEEFIAMLSETLPHTIMGATRVVRRLIAHGFEEVTYWEHRRKRLRFVIADKGTYQVLFTVEEIK